MDNGSVFLILVMGFSGFCLVLNLIMLACNITFTLMNFKAYTEFFKESAQRGRKQSERKPDESI